MTSSERLTGCLKLLEDEIASVDCNLVLKQLSGSQSALFCKYHGSICALQPNCVGTDRLQQKHTVAQTDRRDPPEAQPQALTTHSECKTDRLQH